ncbi:MAG: phosphoribosyltransferase [Opitutae bacterium]|nr:phosphoribosyltransferase [Opitutae bacterium]
MTIRDRVQAGRLLAPKLAKYDRQPDLVVLALPRGGVAVAAEVARALSAPLDALVVRKLGAPFDAELAMGAVADGEVCVLNQRVIAQGKISAAAVEEAVERETRELGRREKAYRPGRPPLEVRHLTVILVDDGIATGATMRAAISVLDQMHAQRVVVAVPVASRASYLELRRRANEFVALATPADFGAVGRFYEDFAPTTDAEVRALLDENAHTHAHGH